MTKQELIKTIIHEIFNDVQNNHYACDNKDAERALYTAGHFASYCNTLRMLGVDVFEGTYNDENNCDRIAYMRVNGEICLYNCDWQDAFWKIHCA